MKTLTQKETLKQQAHTAQQRICLLLGWSELQYAEFIYNTGCAYLKHYIPNDDAGADMLIRCKTYWAWWKLHWQQRDAEFLSHNFSMRSQKDLLIKIYEDYHDAPTLAKEIYPSGIVLGVSYKKMIGELFDNEMHAV